MKFFARKGGGKPEKGEGGLMSKWGSHHFFDFVWNAQKRKWTIFFDCPGKMFPSIEKLSLSFVPHVGPKWNIDLSHYCAKFEHKV